MRAIDMTCMEVVSMGLPWRHAVPPCSKQAIGLLERNTKVVTWLMPKGGHATEQVPCIRYKEKYFSLSLRMQKAIYRHIRLKKGFQNEETVNGMQKLRIPDLLLKEKIRTQSRFDAMRSGSSSTNVNQCDPEEKGAPQNKKSKEAPAPVCADPQKKKKKKKPAPNQPAVSHGEDCDDDSNEGHNAAAAYVEPVAEPKGVLAMEVLFEPSRQNPSSSNDRSKGVNTVAARMKQVVDRMIQSERAGDTQPQLTLFVYRNQQSEITNAFFQEFQKENGSLFRDRDAFLRFLTEHYHEFRHALAHV